MSQIYGHTFSEVKTVADMHERKAEMARQDDSFISLPGDLILCIFKKLFRV